MTDVEAEAIWRELRRMSSLIDGNGQPGMRDKIMDEVKEMLTHQRNNYKQADVDLLHLIQVEKQDRVAVIDEEKQTRKAEMSVITLNQQTISKQVSRLTMLLGSVSVAMGIVKTLEWFGMIRVGVR